MRESRRGSMRSEMATDSEVSELPATAASIRRRSGLFSAQKSASASSLSKIGTSSHLAIARIVPLKSYIVTSLHRLHECSAPLPCVTHVTHVTHLTSRGASHRLPCQHLDRKSTRLNSSHLVISYAVFC